MASGRKPLRFLGLLASVSRDVWNCKRKLRHVEYLSALLHASRLGDPDLDVYPCPVCAGLHVGHDPDRLKRRTLAKELASIERRIAQSSLEGIAQSPSEEASKGTGRMVIENRSRAE